MERRSVPNSSEVDGHTSRRSLIDQLVHAASNSLICSICQDIFNDPLINPACSHSFCRICIYQATQQTNRCPLCRSLLETDKMHPNLALAGLIGDLEAYCRYREHGCQEQKPLDQIHAHERSCRFAPFKCTHAGKGCKFTGNQQSLPEHLRQCPYELFGDFLDVLQRRYASLERRLEQQQSEITELKALLANGGQVNAIARVESDLLPENRKPELRELNTEMFECVNVLANAHSSGVTALCPAQIGDRFVLYTGAHDAKIKVWDIDVSSGESRQRREVEAHKYSIWGLLRLRPQMLYSASADSSILCWDTETLQRVEQEPMTHPGAKIYCMTGCGDMLYTGSADRSIRVWDVRAGARNPVQVLQGHSRSVWSLKMAPSSLGGDDALLSAGNCGNINLWDLRAGKARMTMNFESNEALSVEASPDGKYIFAGSSTSKIYAFDTASGEMKARLSGHQWEVWQLELLNVPACVPLLASGSYDHKINLWSLDHPFRLVKSLSGHKGAVHSLRALGGYLFSGSGDKSIRVWGEKHQI